MGPPSKPHTNDTPLLPRVIRLILTASLLPILAMLPFGFIFCLVIHLIALKGKPLHLTAPWVFTVILLCQWGLPIFSGTVFGISLIGRGDKKWEKKAQREWRRNSGFDRWFGRAFVAVVVVGLVVGVNSVGHLLYETDQNSHGTVHKHGETYGIVRKGRVVRELSHEAYLWHASLTLRRDSSWGMFGCLSGAVFLTMSIAALNPPKLDEKKAVSK